MSASDVKTAHIGPHEEFSAGLATIVQAAEAAGLPSSWIASNLDAMAGWLNDPNRTAPEGWDKDQSGKPLVSGEGMLSPILSTVG